MALGVLRNCRPRRVSRLPRSCLRSSYAMGRARRHLFQVSSPCADIFFESPRSSMHRGSFLILSTARLKWATLLSSEKTSVYKK